jgi:hypothetical protein
MHINLQVLADSGGMIILWLNRVFLEIRELNPRSSIFDQRKSQLYHFTIGFQKPGICTDSTRVWAFVSTGIYFLLPVMHINLQVLADSGGMMVSLVEPCLFGDTGIEPADLDF